MYNGGMKENGPEMERHYKEVWFSWSRYGFVWGSVLL